MAAPYSRSRCGGTVAREPVVIGASQHGRRFRIAYPPEAEADRRVEDHGVDAFAVHVGEARHGVAGARTSLLHRHGSDRGPYIGSGLAHLPEPGEEDLLAPHEHVVESVGIGDSGGAVPLGHRRPG